MVRRQGSSGKSGAVQQQVTVSETIANNDGNPIIGYYGPRDALRRPDGKGSATYANGDQYIGLFKAGIREGRGYMKYRNGTQYWGLFKDNNRYGVEAVQITPRGDKYYGSFLRDLYHGEGTWTYPSGLYGTGTWSNGKNVYWNGFKNELGTFEDNVGSYDGLYYIKKTKDSLGFTVNSYIKEGYGVMRYHNGDVYTGNWTKNNKDSEDGEATMEYNDGRSYKGAFKFDMKNGHGVMKYPNGAKYEGGWHNDMRNGVGRYYNAEDDAEYNGIWRGDTRHGTGTITIGKNTEAYHGEIPLYHSRGITLEGAVFKGEFANDSIVDGVLKLCPDNNGDHLYMLSGPMTNSLALNGNGIFWDKIEPEIHYEGPFVDGRRHGIFQVKEGHVNVTAYTTEFRHDIEIASKRQPMDLPGTTGRGTVRSVDSTSGSSSDSATTSTSSQNSGSSRNERAPTAVQVATRSEKAAAPEPVTGFKRHSLKINGKFAKAEKVSTAVPTRGESTRSSASETAVGTAPSPNEEESEGEVDKHDRNITGGKRGIYSQNRRKKGKEGGEEPDIENQMKPITGSTSSSKKSPVGTASSTSSSKKSPVGTASAPSASTGPKATCFLCKKMYTLEEANVQRAPESTWICSPCVINVILTQAQAQQQAQAGPANKKARK